MIEVTGLSKSFDNIQALQQVSATIQKGSIFGLIGSNGAGKSTFLRLLAGIYRPDAGSIQIDGQPVYENEALKQRIFYISDDQFYFPNSNMEEMAQYYAVVYQKFSWERFRELTELFRLDSRRKLNTFSKGMKKQAHIILALASQPDYLFCDETFDGLDPVMRQAVKRLLADAVVSGHAYHQNGHTVHIQLQDGNIVHLRGHHHLGCFQLIPHRVGSRVQIGAIIKHHHYDGTACRADRTDGINPRNTCHIAFNGLGNHFFYFFWTSTIIRRYHSQNGQFHFRHQIYRHTGKGHNPKQNQHQCCHRDSNGPFY